jgi:hypothetical protein
MGDVGAETTCHQCHSRVATRRPSVLVPGRGPVSRVTWDYGGRVPGCDHLSGESCYSDRSHAQVGRLSPSCFRTNVPHQTSPITGLIAAKAQCLTRSLLWAPGWDPTRFTSLSGERPPRRRQNERALLGPPNIACTRRRSAMKRRW